MIEPPAWTPIVQWGVWLFLLGDPEHRGDFAKLAPELAP
jgi:hypothetical protein